MQVLGTFEGTGPRRSVRFDVGLEHGRGDVWAALTRDEQLVEWLNTTFHIDPRVGGSLRFEFGDGDVCEGTVLTAEPGRRLVYEWRFPQQATTVCWELSGDDHGTRTVLSLTHAGVSSASRATHAAAWHAHLDALDTFLRGGHGDRSRRRWEVWRPRFEHLQPWYVQAVALADETEASTA